jgi:hypothetical protein
MILTLLEDRHVNRALLISIAVLLLSSTAASAGISSISAYGETFSPGTTIPLFVDSGDISIMLKGQFMDLATGVESSDSSFRVRIGRRIMGANSALEVFVDSSSAPDADGSTITIHFAAGQETFRVKSFKTNINDLRLEKAAFATCFLNESVVLKVSGDVGHLMISTAGAMLDVADNHYDLDGQGPTSDHSALFMLKCTALGQFTVKPSWFRDSRVSSPTGDKMVRGTKTFTINVVMPDRTKVP